VDVFFLSKMITKQIKLRLYFFNYTIIYIMFNILSNFITKTHLIKLFYTIKSQYILTDDSKC